MVRSNLNVYDKLDRIVSDVLQNIDEEYKNGGSDEKVYIKFYELFHKESYIEKLNYNDLINTFKDKNLHKYLFYMFECVLNKISLKNNMKYLDFLFIILRYITYFWFYLSEDNKLILISYYYSKLIDLLYNLKLKKSALLINMYNILIYFYIKDKKKVIFEIKKIKENDASTHIKNLILELNKILIYEQVKLITKITKEYYIDCLNEDIEKKLSKLILAEEDMNNFIKECNLYNYMWVCDEKIRYNNNDKCNNDKCNNDKSNNDICNNNICNNNIYNNDKCNSNVYNNKIQTNVTKKKKKEENYFSFFIKYKNKNDIEMFINCHPFSINSSYKIFLNFLKKLF